MTVLRCIYRVVLVLMTAFMAAATSMNAVAQNHLPPINPGTGIHAPLEQRLTGIKIMFDGRTIYDAMSWFPHKDQLLFSIGGKTTFTYIKALGHASAPEFKRFIVRLTVSRPAQNPVAVALLQQCADIASAAGSSVSEGANRGIPRRRVPIPAIVIRAVDGSSFLAKFNSGTKTIEIELTGSGIDEVQCLLSSFSDGFAGQPQPWD